VNKIYNHREDGVLSDPRSQFLIATGQVWRFRWSFNMSTLFLSLQKLSLTHRKHDTPQTHYILWSVVRLFIILSDIPPFASHRKNI